MERILSKGATRRTFLAAAGGAAFGSSSLAAPGKLRVVTTTTDLADLTREIGGERVSVEAIARGYQDPHFVEPKPSFILKLHKADLVLLVGLQLEIGWLPPLITQSRNAKLHSARGYLDVSRFSEILQKPTGAVSRSMGDVHPQGNPHYWLDPENGRRIARAIQDKLAENQPESAEYFAQRFADFSHRLDQAEPRWNAQLAPYKGRTVISYHQSWPNFAKRFGIQVGGYVEPLPGIPPTPRHTLELIQQMKAQNIKLIWYEPYFDSKTPEAIARAVGGEALLVYPSVGGLEKIGNYFELFDYDVAAVAAAFSRTDSAGA